VQAPAVFLNASPCSDLIPDEWYTTGVLSADLPADQTIGAWMSFGDAQTGQLDKANSETKDAVTIVKKCEARDKAAAASVAPSPWWEFWR